MKRIDRMIAGIGQAAAGNYAVRLETSARRDELDSLAAAVNHLLEQVEGRLTDCRETEEVLRESQEDYRRLEANIPGMVYTYKFEAGERHVFPYASEGSRELFGVEPEDLEQDGSLLAGLIHPDDIERRDASIKQSMDTLQPWREELRHIVNGEVRWYDCMSRPERQPDGEILWNGIILEITERKQAEEKLNRNLGEMTLLQEISHLISSSISLDHMGKSIIDGIAEALDPDVVLIFLKDNGKLRLLADGPEDSRFKHDSTPDHFVGECLCGLVVRDGQAIYSKDITIDPRCTWEECKKAGLKSFAALPLMSGDQVLGVLGLASGSPRDFEQEAPLLETLAAEISLGLRNSLLLEEATTRADELAQEITERQRAEEELRKTTETLQTLVQASPAAIMAMDPDGILTLWNPAAERIFGWSAAEALGQFLPFVSQDNYEEYLSLREQVLRGELTEFEARRHRKDGSPVDISFCAAPLRDAQGNITGVMSVNVDVTVRQRAQAELVKNIAMLNEMGAIARIGGWEHDLITGEATWTEALYDIIEIESGPIPGPKEHLDYYPPKDRAILAEAIQRAIETGEPFDLELQGHTAKKRLFWARVIGRPVFQDGKCIRLVGTFQDITERKKAEEALRESEERLRLALSAANQGLFDLNVKTGEAQVTPEYATMLGYDPADFHETNARWLARLHPDDREGVAATYRAYVKGEIPDYAVEFRQRTKAGDWKWILSLGRIVAWDNEGRPLRMLGTYTDITERKRAEQELRKTTETLQALILASPAAIIAHDPDGTVTLWNPAAERMLGWSADEALGQSPPQIPQDKYEEHLTLFQGALRGELPKFEVRRQRKDGSPIDLNISTAPFRDAQGKVTGIISVQVDVTERKQMEEKLRESEAKFRQLGEFSPFPIGIISGDAPEYLNPKFIETFGYTLKDLPNMETWFRLAYPDPAYRQRVLEKWQTELKMAVEENRAPAGLEVEMTCKDGTVRTIEVWSVPVGSKILGFCVDLTERKRMEAALEKRLVALSRPLDEAGDISFDDLFNLDEIQRIQDLFAKVTGVASLITDPEGMPLTAPSNFCRLCKTIVRQSELGTERCMASDAMIGRYYPDGPIIQHCMSAGLCNAGASITVGGKHVANWLVGQVRDGTQTEESMRDYARSIEVDEEEFITAFREVPMMPEEQFKQVAQAFFVLANQLSNMAYQNIQQARFITERQRAEEELRESEERLRLALSAANQGLYDLNIRTGEAQVTPEYATMLGYDPADFHETNARWIARLHPDDREGVAATYRAYVRGEIPDYAVEFRQRTKSGDWMWILSLGKIVAWDEEGRPLRMLGTHTDITERQRAEEELRKNEKKYRSLYQEFQAILNAIPDGLSLISPDFRIVWGNEATTFGIFSVSETLGQHCFTLRHGRSEPCEDCPVLRCFRSGKLETQEVTTFGRIWELYAVPLYDDEGELRGAIEVARDITERKRSEEALKQSEAKYRRLHESMTDAFAIVDMSGRITEANRAYLTMLGYSEEELRELTYHDLTPEKWHAFEEWIVAEQVLVQGFSGVYEKEYRQKDGTVFPVEMRTYLLRDDAGQPIGMWAIVRDITERKRAEEALRLTQFAMDNSPDAVFWLKPDGSFLYVNEEACRSLEYSREELESLSIFDIDRDLTPEKWFPHWQWAKQQERVMLETYQRTKKGRIFPVEVKADFVEYGGQEFFCTFVRDITERKQAEAALRESEERYRLLFQNANDAIYLLDPETRRVLDCNRKAAEMVGYSVEELKQMTVNQLHPPDELSLVDEAFRVVKAGGACVGLPDMHYRRKDGRLVPIEASGTIFTLGDRQLKLTIVRDITERKRAEEEIRKYRDHLEKLVAERTAELSKAYESLVENEARYRLLAENITDVIWTMDFNLHFTYLSPSVQLLRGFTPQETMAQSLKEIFLPESLQTIQQVLGEELLRERQGTADLARVREFELEVQRRDGSTIWVEVRASFVRDLNLRAIGILGVARDISRRRRAEEALRESEARFRTIFSHAPLGIVLRDLEGRMLEANPAALKILGYSFEEISRVGSDFVHPEDYKRYQQFMKTLERDHTDHGEVELRARRKDGTWAWGRLHLSLVREPSGEVQYLLGMIEDISRLKQWEEEIRSYQERLRSLASELTLTEERERRRLATNLHDNVGQVLALTQIKLGSLADDATSPASQDEMREVRDLITQVIHTTRSLTFELGSPILYELGLEEAVESLAEHYENEYGLHIRVEREPLPEFLEDATSLLLFRALQELLTNVVKHAEADNIWVALKVRDDQITLQVRDDGRGFDVKPNGSHWYRHLGFGLFSLRERLSQLGGEMEVESHPGQGTLVWISLPLARKDLVTH